MLNVVVLMGRLTKEVTIIPSKEPEKEVAQIVRFDLAVDNPQKEKDGTRGSSFFQVVCFRNIENLVKSLHKGSKVIVKGAIQQRNFLKKDGSKGVSYDIIADSISFVDPKPVEEQVDVEDIAPDQEIPTTPVEEPKFDPYTGKPLNKETK